jgi:hypothetical protein
MGAKTLDGIFISFVEMHGARSMQANQASGFKGVEVC